MRLIPMKFWSTINGEDKYSSPSNITIGAYVSFTIVVNPLNLHPPYNRSLFDGIQNMNIIAVIDVFPWLPPITTRFLSLV